MRRKTASLRCAAAASWCSCATSLAPNTTYALDFGSAIRDNNEGNPLYSMRYVFSTGGEIDSMICSGYTADAYEADSVPRSFLWFFPPTPRPSRPSTTPRSTSTVRPSSRAPENNGIFIAQNLKPVPYRIYAFEDTNGNQLYDPSVDRVGFLDEARNPAELPDFAIWHDSVRGYATAEPATLPAHVHRRGVPPPDALAE